MFFLLRDYLQYRSLKGRYDNGAGSLIPDLFDEKIPDEVLAILKPGDQIWMASKHSIRSWLIMYYCQIPLSHTVIYLGERQILHATTERGAVKQKIDELFDQGLRFLPCRMLIGNKAKRESLQETASKYVGIPYWYRYVFLAWLYIVSGRNWASFKWEFYLDFLFIYLLLAAVEPCPFNYVFYLLAIVHLTVISIFALLWKFKPIPFNMRGMSLNMFFAICFENGMMPLINKFSTPDEVEIVAVYREKD